MNVNGSVTPQVYDFKPSTLNMAEDEDFIMTRMFLTIEDNANFSPSTFGALTQLTNGVVVKLNDDILFAFLNNSNVAEVCYDITWGSVFQKAEQYMTARITFAKFTNGGIKLKETTDSISLTVNDDLTGLVKMNCVIQGYIRKT